MEQRVRGQRAARIDALGLETFDGGTYQGQILVSERAIFARMRIEAGDGKARTRDAEALMQVAGDDAAGLDHEVCGEFGDDVLERKVDGDRHHCELGRPQHHHRPDSRAGRFLDQLTEIFGVSGLGKARAIEDVLGNRIGHDRGRRPGADIGHRAANGRKRRRRARLIRMARFCADRHADVDDG